MNDTSHTSRDGSTRTDGQGGTGSARVRRRQFLAGAGVAVGVGTAGCAGLFDDGGSRAPQSGALVEDRPDAVYHPTHSEGMEMVGMASDGRYRLSLSYGFPHRFWLLTGDRRREVSLREDDSIHLMLTAWDGETGTMIPSSSATVAIARDGDQVVEKPPWEMLSQRMGAHFGDNVALPGDGTYDVSVSFGPLEPRVAGALAGDFSEPASVEFSMQFQQSTLRALPYQEYPQRQGERDALGPMDMDMGGDMDMNGDGEMGGGSMDGNGSMNGNGSMDGGMSMRPSGQLPAPADTPGRLLGEGTSGDAAVVAVALDEIPAGIDGDGTYLAVSPRTPYNRYPFAGASLSGTIERGGDSVFDESLVATLHDGLGFHYGAVVPAVETGDSLDIHFDASPRIGRHEGYEMAFLEMEPIELTV